MHFAGRTVIRAGRLVDGTHAEPFTEVALVLEGSRIGSVEAWSEELRRHVECVATLTGSSMPRQQAGSESIQSH